MTRSVRITAFLLLAALALLPASAAAAPLAIDAGWLNSNFVFGGPSFSDEGYDVNLVELYDVTIAEEGDPLDVFFGAGGGSLESVTALPGQTDYRYEGGTFFLQFEGDVMPFFTAPIESLDISVFGDIEPGAGITVTYALGPGLFDAALAALHGVPQPDRPWPHAGIADPARGRSAVGGDHRR